MFRYDSQLFNYGSWFLAVIGDLKSRLRPWLVGDIVTENRLQRAVFQTRPDYPAFCFLLGLGIYKHALLCSIPPQRVNTKLILQTSCTRVFGANSADCAPKSRCWSTRSLWAKDRSEEWSQQLSFELFDPCVTIRRFFDQKTSLWISSEGVLPRIASSYHQFVV